MHGMVRKPDLKAPRVRKPTGYCPISMKLWRKFTKQTGTTCTYKEFGDIIRASNKIITEIVIDERDGFKLMEEIGNLILVAFKMKPEISVRDYVRLNKEGVNVKYRNFHTENRVCSIVYSSYQVREHFLNRKLWAFIPVRSFKRGASKAFSENYNMYRVIQGFETSSKMFNNENKFSKQLEEEDFLKNQEEEGEEEYAE